MSNIRRLILGILLAFNSSMVSAPFVFWILQGGKPLWVVAATWFVALAITVISTFLALQIIMKMVIKISKLLTGAEEDKLVKTAAKLFGAWVTGLLLAWLVFKAFQTPDAVFYIFAVAASLLFFAGILVRLWMRKQM